VDNLIQNLGHPPKVDAGTSLLPSLQRSLLVNQTVVAECDISHQEE
jgi:hypothetical protein